MKLFIIGAGPAGLGLAYLTKKACPTWSIEVVERRQRGENVGWGITFPFGTFASIDYSENLHYHCTQAEMRYRGNAYLVTPIDSGTIARDALLQFLLKRCEAQGVSVRYGTDIESVEDLASKYDLVVGADGVNSTVRNTFPRAFVPTKTASSMYFTWLSTSKLYDNCLPSMFREYEGHLFVGWGYQYTAERSTFIVECSPTTLKHFGLDSMSTPAACEFIAAVFRDELEGNPVFAGDKLRWLNFPFLKSEKWHHQQYVILGDAAHTAHYSRGYGTELALGDSVALSRHLTSGASMSDALTAFEKERKPYVSRYQMLALSSHNWYAGVLRKYAQDGSVAIEAAIREVEEKAPIRQH